jgi:hypothetical protein
MKRQNLIKGQSTKELPEGYADFLGIKYVMDPKILEDQGRSVEALLLARIPEERRDSIKALPTVKSQIREIAKTDAKESEFLDSSMPLRELAFRLILKSGNKSMPLNDLHWTLTEGWAHPTHPMAISVYDLKRIMDSDVYYGFHQVTD